MVLGILLPIAFGVGVWAGMFPLAPKRAPPPVASVAPKKAEPAPSAAPPETLTDEAAAGDYKALDELKAKKPEDRTVEETLALARGRSGNKSRALEGFAKEIAKSADLLKDKDQLQRLREFLMDRETATQAAGVIVGLPGALGPDLLFEAASNPKAKGETAELTEDLLATKEVRDKASPALKVALDLRRAEQCEDFKALLVPVRDDGDRRSLLTLNKLFKKRGCGTSGADDCYACIRPLDKDKEAVSLGVAIKAAEKRHAPKL
jgi:hypothetical protein